MSKADELTLGEVRDGIHLVERRRGEDVVVYAVDPNRLRCDCEAGRRGRICRHIRLVLDRLEGRR